MKRLWVKGLLFAGCMIVLYPSMISGCVAKPLRQPQDHLYPAHQKLKVVTFNVNYAGSNMPLAAKVLRATKADVVALQETTPAWERYLRRAFRHRYPYIAFRHFGGAGGMGFLSRYPMRTIRHLSPPGKGWFPAWLMAVRSHLGEFDILNVHLRPPLPENGRLSSIPSAYFRTRSIRRNEIKSHLLKARKHRPLLVVGDFNENEQGRAFRWLRQQRKLRSALMYFDRKNPTWQWPTSLITLRNRYDHIFYSSHFRCVNAKVLPEAGSDHFPVMAILIAKHKKPSKR